jgi:hypothetical protein
MNKEIGTEAAQFPKKEDINGIFVGVHSVFTFTSILLSENLHMPKHALCPNARSKIQPPPPQKKQKNIL